MQSKDTIKLINCKILAHSKKKICFRELNYDVLKHLKIAQKGYMPTRIETKFYYTTKFIPSENKT
jgi:hypothetical protein